jgi:hypothetical protein
MAIVLKIAEKLEWNSPLGSAETLNRWEAVSEIIKQLKIKEKGTHR